MMRHHFDNFLLNRKIFQFVLTVNVWNYSARPTLLNPVQLILTYDLIFDKYCRFFVDFILELLLKGHLSYFANIISTFLDLL